MSCPASVLVVHAGGLGDLVLLADTFVSMRRVWPETRLTLACASRFAGVASLMPSPPDELVPIPFNPYLLDRPSPQVYTKVRAFLDEIRSISPEILYAAGFSYTWLEWTVNSALRPARSIGHAATAPPRGLLRCLLDEFSLGLREFEAPGKVAFSHEKQRSAAMLALLDVAHVDAPAWRLPENASAAAAQCLAELGLEPKRYLACFPLGSPPVKCWPADRFREVIEKVTEEFGLSTLLIGDHSEGAELHRIASMLPRARVFTGNIGDVPNLAGLLANAKGWLGVDSGPMHLAQAYRVPGVAIFGGGTNVVYAPWAAGAIGLVQPLPCFGCYWDCAFGHAICVESVPVAEVVAALREAVTGPAGPPRLQPVDAVSAEMRSLIGDAASRYREADKDRRDRYALLVEIEREAERRLVLIDQLHSVAAESTASRDESDRSGSNDPTAHLGVAAEEVVRES